MLELSLLVLHHFLIEEYEVFFFSDFVRMKKEKCK